MEGKKSLNMGGKRRKLAIGSQGYQDFEGFSSGDSLSLIERLAELEMYLIFVVPCIMLNSEINPTRCNNCVYSTPWLYSTCFG